MFEPSSEDVLAPAAEAFINDARPRVVVYPGSADLRARAFTDLVIHAAQALGQRVMVLSRFHSSADSSSSGDVLWVDEAPLRRVLSTASAFVHHGGIGSMAQGMSARVPQLALVSAYDQFDNGARLQNLEKGQWQPIEQTSIEDVQNFCLTGTVASGSAA